MIDRLDDPAERLSEANQAIGSPPPSDNSDSDNPLEFPQPVSLSPGAKPVTPPIPADESQSTDVSRRQPTKGKVVKRMRTRASNHLATLFATLSSESEVEFVEESDVGMTKTNRAKDSRRDRKGKGRAASESVENNGGESIWTRRSFHVANFSTVASPSGSATPKPQSIK
jgi:hypothetical protein